MSRRVRPVLLLFILWAALSHPGFLFAASATLTPLQGHLFIEHVGATSWENVSQPIQAQEGDQIRSDDNTLAFMVLPDDHRVAIGANTLLVLSRLASGQIKINLQAGQIRNKVMHHLQPTEYYNVQTPTAVCGVRGTDFSVMIQNTGNIPSGLLTKVAVYEGFVDLSGLKQEAANAVLHLSAGQVGGIDAKGMVHQLSGLSASESNHKTNNSSKSATPSQAESKSSRNGPPPPGGGSAGTPGTGSGPSAGLSSTSPTAKPSASSDQDWYNQMNSPHPTMKFDSNSLFTAPAVEPSNSNLTTGPQSSSPMPQPPPLPSGVYGPTSPLMGQGSLLGNAQLASLSGSDGLNNNPIVPALDPLFNNQVNNSNQNAPNNDPHYDPLATANGFQALVDEVYRQNLATSFRANLVGDLFRDGSVKMGPDGNLHQFADYITKTANNQITFVNATMIDQKPATLDFESTVIAFNAPLPSHYIDATKTAFYSPGPTSPAYYATDVWNSRTNGTDVLQMTAHGGQPVFLNNSDASGYATVFSNQSSIISGPTYNKVLWTYDPVNGFLQLPGTPFQTHAPPTVTTIQYGDSETQSIDTFADGTTLSRHLSLTDANGNFITPTTLPSGASTQQLLSHFYFTDTLNSNLFSKPITNFASALSVINAGMINDFIDPATGQFAIFESHVHISLAPDGLVSKLSLSSMQGLPN